MCLTYSDGPSNATDIGSLLIFFFPADIPWKEKRKMVCFSYFFQVHVEQKGGQRVHTPCFIFNIQYKLEIES